MSVVIQGAARRLSNKVGWIARLITRSDARRTQGCGDDAQRKPDRRLPGSLGLSGHGWRGVGGGKFTDGSKSDLQPAF
ncbi:hypothetical protein OE699_04715 [Sedimentimonas flavescens]|uniref:Uncharacterized protein n=1 Tax=Sedimentimonas flavescens TaxID=2851012 RepID=A0ABT2ZWM4_9RHOB|nr:hypothetical protein [Sedimentimonas flavescens]MCV2878148.1 hypothetical protein [Sedimentimonas flavescens]